MELCHRLPPLMFWSNQTIFGHFNPSQSVDRIDHSSVDNTKQYRNVEYSSLVSIVVVFVEGAAMEAKDQEQDPEDDTIPVTDSEEEREAADKRVYSSLDHHKPQKRNQLRVRVPNCSERSTSTGSQGSKTE